MIDVLPDNVGPSSTLSVPRSSVSETARMVGMPSTDRVTCSSVTVMSALLLQPRDFHGGYDGQQSNHRWRQFRQVTIAIQAWIAATRCLRRCRPTLMTSGT